MGLINQIIVKVEGKGIVHYDYWYILSAALWSAPDIHKPSFAHTYKQLVQFRLRIWQPCYMVVWHSGGQPT